MNSFGGDFSIWISQKMASAWKRGLEFSIFFLGVVRSKNLHQIRCSCKRENSQTIWGEKNYLYRITRLWVLKKIKLSTRKHIRKNLQAEFGDVILFKNLIETTGVFIVPAYLTPLQIARYITTLLLERQGNASQSSKGANIHQAAIDIREAIQRTENKISWPPRREYAEYSSRIRFVPANINDWKQRVSRWRLSSRLTKSFAQDLIFGVSREKN